jgi:hypothetical protein
MLPRQINPHHSYHFGNETVKTFGKVGVIPFVPPKPGQVFKVGMPNPNAVKSSIERAK